MDIKSAMHVIGKNKLLYIKLIVIGIPCVAKEKLEVLNKILN